MELVVGMDVHKDTIAVSLIDRTGREREATAVENTAAGHQGLVGWLSERAPAARCGMELSGGIARGLAVALCAAGHLVVAVTPRLSSREARRLRSRARPIRPMPSPSHG
ncbi:hypothetical protein BH20ACT24_BH20ACT24_15050 [soil metagenome]